MKELPKATRSVFQSAAFFGLAAALVGLALLATSLRCTMDRPVDNEEVAVGQRGAASNNEEKEDHSSASPLAAGTDLAASADQNSEGSRESVGTASPGTLILHVLREDDKTPIQGATVRDSNGRTLETEVIATGTLGVVGKVERSEDDAELEVSAPGYLWRDYELRLGESEATVHLEEARHLVVQVVDAVSEIPQSGIRVSGTHKLRWENYWVDASTTDDLGLTTLDIPNGPGRFDLRIFGEGFSMSMRLDCSGELPEPFRVAVGGLGTIQARILGLEGRTEEGQLPAWASVAHKDVQTGLGIESVTQSFIDGGFRLEGLPLDLPLEVSAGPYRGDWEARTLEPLMLTQQVPEANVTLVAKDRETTPTLVVKLVGPQGKAFDSGVYSVRAETMGPPGIADPWNWGDGGVGATQFGEDEPIGIPLPRPDTYRIVVRRDDWVLAESTVNWPQESEVTMTVDLKSALSVCVTRKGLPVPNARISTHLGEIEPRGLWGTDWNRQGETDATGCFTIHGLPADQEFCLLVEDGGHDGFLVEGLFVGDAAVEVELPDRMHVIARVPGVPRGASTCYGMIYGGNWIDANLDLDLEGRMELALSPCNEERALWIGLPDDRWVTCQIPPGKPGDHIDLGDLLPDVGVAFAGRIVDERGEPLVGAGVGISHPLIDWGMEYEADTDDEGRFRFESVPSHGVELYMSTDEGSYYEEIPGRVTESGRTFVLPRQATLQIDVTADHVGSLLSFARNGGATDDDVYRVHLETEGTRERHFEAGTWKVWLRSPPSEEWIDLGSLSMEPGQELTLDLP